MNGIVRLPVEAVRAVVLEAAGWLEGCRFAASPAPGVGDAEAARLAQAWCEGFSRAVFELRALVDPGVRVPDDLSGMEPCDDA